METQGYGIGPVFAGADENRDVLEEASTFAEEYEARVLCAGEGNRRFGHACDRDPRPGDRALDLLNRDLEDRSVLDPPAEQWGAGIHLNTY